MRRLVLLMLEDKALGNLIDGNAENVRTNVIKDPGLDTSD